VLVAVFPKIVAAAKPGGHVVISGILNAQAGACLAAGRKAGIRFGKPVRRGKWVTARGIRGPLS
jgi:ribosomal protein L11 methyltransferase